MAARWSWLRALSGSWAWHPLAPSWVPCRLEATPFSLCVVPVTWYDYNGGVLSWWRVGLLGPGPFHCVNSVLDCEVQLVDLG